MLCFGGGNVQALCGQAPSVARRLGAVAKNAYSLWALPAEAPLSSGWKVLVAVLPRCRRTARRWCVAFAYHTLPCARDTLPLPTIPYPCTLYIASD